MRCVRLRARWRGGRLAGERPGASEAHRGGRILGGVRCDRSEQRRLTFQGSYNQTPQWSPRGDLIAFTARDERRVFDVFAVTLDGARIQRLTQDQGRTNEEPSWAPNGRMVAFTSDRGGAPQLVVSDPRGERQTVITSGGELTTPAWGPLPAE